MGERNRKITHKPVAIEKMSGAGSSRPLPSLPTMRGDDTLRRNKKIPKTCGQRAENLYDEPYNTNNFATHSEHSRNPTYDAYINVCTMKPANSNRGPFIRKNTILERDCSFKYKQYPPEKLVKMYNTKGSGATAAATGNDELDEIEHFIKFNLLKQMRTNTDLSGLFHLMRTNNYSIKSLTAAVIEEILIRLELFRLSEDECKTVIVTGLQILIDEFCEVQHKTKSSVLVLELMFTVIACIFIWMINSNWTSIKTMQADLSKCIKPCVEITGSTLLVKTFLNCVRCVCTDLPRTSYLRIAECDGVLRDKTTRFNIIAHFQSMSCIEQIACVYMLASATIRHEDFYGTLGLLDECIRNVSTNKNVKELHSLLFFADKTARTVLNTLEEAIAKKDDRCRIEKEVLGLFDTIERYGFDTNENLMFHKNFDIRKWFFNLKVAKGRDIGNKLVHLCNQHIENSLLRCNVEIQGRECDNRENRNPQTLAGNGREPIWKENRCKLFGKYGQIKVLYPSVQCLQSNYVDDYKKRADKKLTTCYMNELDILAKMAEYGGHENIVELVWHQSIPYPLYYIVYDNNAENLQSVLLERRQEKNPFQLKTVLEIVIQALKAIDFLHGKGIVHRSITACAFIFDSTRYITNNTVFVQLSDLKLSRELWKAKEKPKRCIADLQCEEIPTRWSAPESLMRGIFSRYSDYWMFYMFTAEVFEHGRWPLTDSGEHTTETIMTNMLFHDIRVQEQTCIPKPIYLLLLDGTVTEAAKRLELERFETHLVDFLPKVEELTNEVYNSAAITWNSDSVFPKLSKLQLNVKSVPEKGIPESIGQYRETDKDPEDVYYADREIRRSERPYTHRIVTKCDIQWIDEARFYHQDGVPYIEEKVFEKFVDNIWPILYHLNPEALLLTPQWPPLPVKSKEYATTNEYSYNLAGVQQIEQKVFGKSVDNWPKTDQLNHTEPLTSRWPSQPILSEEHTSEKENEFILRYVIPDSRTFLEICIHRQFGSTIEELLELIFKLALLVDAFHEEGWILNCLRAKNIRVTPKKEIFIPRIGRFLYIRSKTTAYFQNVHHEIPADMKYWSPLETIENNIVSIRSDVYSFGMFLSEVCAILTEDVPRYENEIYEPVGNNPELFQDIELKVVPFGHVHVDQLGPHLKEGNIPPKLECCPEWLYDIMVRCWEINGPDRPTMRDIIELLKPNVSNYRQIAKCNLRSEESRHDKHQSPQPPIPIQNRILATDNSIQGSDHFSSSSESRSASVCGVNHSNSDRQTSVKRTPSNGISANRYGRIQPKKRSSNASVINMFETQQ